MALKMNEVKKLSMQQAVEKLQELEKSMLELMGEGKREKQRSVKQAIARVKTHIHQLEAGQIRKNLSAL